MNKAVASMGLSFLLLLGAGCVPAEEPSQTSEEVGVQETIEVGDSAETSPSERGIDISGDSEARDFFGDTRTSQHLYDSYKIFKTHSSRMVKDIIDATPAGSAHYKKYAWGAEDPVAIAMEKAGEDAAATMFAAQDAFEENKSNQDALATSARAKVDEWLVKILAFEARWNVGPR